MNTLSKWTIHNDSDDYRQYRVEAKSWGIILRVEDESDEPEANARLIAAAPDMLAALKEAREVLETAKQYFPLSIKNRDRFRLENVLANAVNKAIGKATV